MKPHPLRKIKIFNFLIEKYINRITPKGTFFIIILFVSMIFGFNPDKSMLHQISILSLSFIIIAYIFTFRFKTKIKIERELPELCIINKKTRYSIIIKNNNKKKVSNLFFKDVTNQFLMSSELQIIPYIKSNNSIELDNAFTPLKRGYIHIEGFNIYKEDPFGLLRKSFFIKAPANILVLPQIYNMPFFNFLGKRKYNQGGIPYAEKKGESEEFISLKKYKNGDSIKRINWKATAKTGELFVNEYQEEYFSRYGLILDTFSKIDNDVFEEAISIASSILTGSDIRDSILDIMFLGSDAYKFTIAKGINSKKKALEVLASISICKNKLFDSLHSLIKTNIHLLNSVVLVLIEIDEDRVKLINLLEKYDIEIKVFLVSKKPSISAGKIKKLGIKTAINILDIGDIKGSLKELE